MVTQGQIWILTFGCNQLLAAVLCDPLQTRRLCLCVAAKQMPGYRPGHRAHNQQSYHRFPQNLIRVLQVLALARFRFPTLSHLSLFAFLICAGPLVQDRARHLLVNTRAVILFAHPEGCVSPLRTIAYGRRESLTGRLLLSGATLYPLKLTDGFLSVSWLLEGGR